MAKNKEKTSKYQKELEKYGKLAVRARLLYSLVFILGIIIGIITKMSFIMTLIFAFSLALIFLIIFRVYHKKEANRMKKLI